MYNELEENVDWMYVIPEDVSKNLQIKILSGDFKDTVYGYGSVSIKEERNEEVYVSFNYNIYDTPLVKEELEKNPEFKNFIGDILMNVISQKIDKGLKDETGTNNTEKSNIQR